MKRVTCKEEELNEYYKGVKQVLMEQGITRDKGKFYAKLEEVSDARHTQWAETHKIPKNEKFSELWYAACVFHILFENSREEMIKQMKDYLTYIKKPIPDKGQIKSLTGTARSNGVYDMAYEDTLLDPETKKKAYAATQKTTDQGRAANGAAASGKPAVKAKSEEPAKAVEKSAEPVGVKEEEKAVEKSAETVEVKAEEKAGATKIVETTQEVNGVLENNKLNKQGIEQEIEKYKGLIANNMGSWCQKYPSKQDMYIGVTKYQYDMFKVCADNQYDTRRFLTTVCQEDESLGRGIKLYSRNDNVGDYVLKLKVSFSNVIEVENMANAKKAICESAKSLAELYDMSCNTVAELVEVIEKSLNKRIDLVRIPVSKPSSLGIAGVTEQDGYVAFVKERDLTSVILSCELV